MINLKKIFWPNPRLISVTKCEKDLLEHFVTNTNNFGSWLKTHPQNRVHFRFYFPTAIDFYFDDFILFTAYFKKDAQHVLQLQELKMSGSNYASIRTRSWKPFSDVILHFLTTLEENTKTSLFQKQSALYEYQSICEKEPGQISEVAAEAKAPLSSLATG